MREWLGYVLAVIFLVATVVTYIHMDKKIEGLYLSNAVDAAQTAIEASDNLYPVYEFAKYEHTEGVIDSVKFGESIQKVVDTHDKLLLLVETKVQGEKSIVLKNELVNMLEARREAYSNLKSAIDLSSENFNEVASNKFQEAEETKTRINQLLVEMK